MSRNGDDGCLSAVALLAVLVFIAVCAVWWLVTGTVGYITEVQP